MKPLNVIIAVCCFCILGGVIIDANHVNNQFKLVNTRLEQIEGRIMLHDGKAVLTNGELCIIKNEALADENLAIQLVRACVHAHKQQVDQQDSENATYAR